MLYFSGDMEYCHGQENGKKSRFTTTTTPCQKSNVGIRRISTALRRSCCNFHLTMAPSARLCLGKGARCSCLVKFIRPSKDVAAALVNPPKLGRRIDDLIALSRDVTTRGGKRFVSIFFWSSTIPGLLHAAEQWFKVEEQGPLDQLWEDAAPAEAPTATAAIDEDGKEIADFVFNAQNRAEDIALIRDMGLWSTTTTNPPLRTSLLMAHPLSMGRHSWKGRSGGGTALIAKQFCKA